MSLHTIVNDGHAGRRMQRRASAAAHHAVASTVAQPGMELSGRLSGMSMRILETGLAIIAIATALLIGLGR
ncbi:MAG TPA: hypothetical protein VFP56_00390 [Candidatus Limnocylindrales bacterium]|nr:hypothetical protein [Candidatus Limnocylindrales bacterium]